MPGSRDIPKVFNVKLLENADNEEKQSLDPKLLVNHPYYWQFLNFLALKEAIKASSEGSKPELLNSPATPSEIFKSVEGLTS